MAVAEVLAVLGAIKGMKDSMGGGEQSRHPTASGLQPSSIGTGSVLGGASAPNRVGGGDIDRVLDQIRKIEDIINGDETPQAKGESGATEAAKQETARAQETNEADETGLDRLLDLFRRMQ